jgi:hypothetical protein
MRETRKRGRVASEEEEVEKCLGGREDEAPQGEGTEGTMKEDSVKGLGENEGEDEEGIALSYNEIRQRNIARNEEFLNYLFPEGIFSKEMDGDHLSQGEISDHDPSSSKMNIKEICQRIQHQLPSRSQEMLRIFEYLDQVSALG